MNKTAKRGKCRVVGSRVLCSFVMFPCLVDAVHRLSENLRQAVSPANIRNVAVMPRNDLRLFFFSGVRHLPGKPADQLQ